MLDTAVAMVNRTGLTVSLDHISFEDVIRDAGVSRTAVYRRWPYKQMFFSDLLKELARAAAPAAAVSEETGKELLRAVVAANSADLTAPAARHALVIELIRQGALGDFEAVHRSTEWRTYLALHATFLSLAEGQLRDEVQAALVRSERGFNERIAGAWQRIATVLGYRLRAGAGAGFDTLATLATATLRGLVTMALSDPDLVNRRISADPGGTGNRSDWSVVALGAVGVAMTLLEPDPDIQWDEQRQATLSMLLDAAAP
jgi:AcrR family transcriptional regulator